MAEDKADKGTAEKELPAKSHWEVADKGLKPYGNKVDPRMFKDQRCPKAHNRTHAADGDACPHSSDQNRVVFSGNRDFKSDFRNKTVDKEKSHNKAYREHDTHFSKGCRKRTVSKFPGS